MARDYSERERRPQGRPPRHGQQDRDRCVCWRPSDAGSDPAYPRICWRRVHQRRCARCETEKAMTDAWGRLHVEVLEDEIIITLPFTNYTVTYYKPASSPGLLAKNFPTKDDSRAPMTQAEFLERAWKRANDKARAFGWIV